MASAQQKSKPESKRGQRNGDRRNGKAWAKSKNKPPKGPKLVTLPDGTQVRKSYYGYSRARILAMVEQRGGKTTFDTIVAELAAKHAAKKQYRQNTPAYARRAAKLALERLHAHNRNAKGKPKSATTAAPEPDPIEDALG